MRRRQRGAALVLVIWLVALLTALVGAYAATARIEDMQGRGLQG
ncbi:MAG: general secretion pathway protein GspK, partial [Gammaproteobacteria bacterium]|nr:general secretion pathway protein GspK [Gammaproteobacteria bacterium]